MSSRFNNSPLEGKFIEKASNFKAGYVCSFVDADTIKSCGVSFPSVAGTNADVLTLADTTIGTTSWTTPSAGGGAFEIAGTGDDPYSISVDDTGKTGFLSATATGSQEIILPQLGTPETEGLYYKLQVSSDFAGSSRIIWPYDQVSLDLIKGSVNYIANGGATAGASDQHIIFAATASPGDFIELVSFDGKWYVSGQCALDNSIIYGPDPCATFTLQNAIVPSDGVSSDQFGHSISINGSYCVVGSNHPMNPGEGSCYIFENLAGTWTQVQKCVASDAAAKQHLGWSSAISGDYMISSKIPSYNAVDKAGGVYIYYNSGSGFPATETQKLVASDTAANDWFGYQVSIDGIWIFAGGYGGAYVLKDTSGTWSETQKLTNSDAVAADMFGSAGAVSGDFMVIGAYKGDNTNGVEAGAAYIFKNTAGTWAETQKIIASTTGYSDHFGYSVAIDGNFLIIGMIGDDDKGSAAGAAEIHENVAGTWTFRKKIVASNGAYGNTFGRSVAISGDVAIVGATMDVSQGGGATYIFNKNCGGSANWGEVQTIAGSTNGDKFGFSVGASSTHMAMGEIFGGSLNEGKAYIYN